MPARIVPKISNVNGLGAVGSNGAQLRATTMTSTFCAINGRRTDPVLRFSRALEIPAVPGGVGWHRPGVGRVPNAPAPAPGETEKREAPCGQDKFQVTIRTALEEMDVQSPRNMTVMYLDRSPPRASP
jgi:hypothetical protein